MALISWRTWEFKEMFAALPENVRATAVKNFLLWKENPMHPSLHFKEWAPGLWSIRVGIGYRALIEEKADGAFLWYWIGPHGSYDKLM